MAHVVDRPLYATVLISSANQASESVDAGRFTEAAVYVKATAKAGTTPAVTFDVETSHDNTDWHVDSTIPVITDPTVPFNAPVHRIVGALGKWIRLNNPAAPTGSGSPTLTVSAVVVLKV